MTAIIATIGCAVIALASIAIYVHLHAAAAALEGSVTP